MKSISVINGDFAGVYLIKEKATGRPYIGQTSLSINERLNQHVNNKLATSGIDLAIREKGINAFEFSVVTPMWNPTAEQLWFEEQRNIELYDSCENGYNLTHGNHKGKFTEVVKDYCKNFPVVSKDLFKRLIRDFKLDFTGKKVLLINHFDQICLNNVEFNAAEVISIYKATADKTELSNYIIDTLKEYYGMHFDLIISNPPYGKVGNEITKNIIDNVDFDEFVNLLPANDYKRVKENKLWQYVDLDTMSAINNGFKDAAVTTHVTKIRKKPTAYISETEFEIENYIDDSLRKYFYENIERRTSIIDTYLPKQEFILKSSSFTSAIFTKRDASNKHLPYSKKCNSYRWNIENSISSQYLIDNTAADFNNTVSVEILTFESEINKTNFVNFIYSKDGFRFVSKLFSATNVDSRINLLKVFPKVDWSREWTVEEILADYGYSETEIKEVMDDLVNYKYMND